MRSCAVSLSLLGWRCPLVLLEAKKALTTLEKDACLEVISDDPSSLIDFKTYVSLNALIQFEFECRSGIYYFYLKKTG